MSFYSEKFLNYLSQVKRYAHCTLLSYRTDIDQLELFLKETYNIDGCHEADAPMLRTWFAYLMDQGVSRSTFNRKRSSLRSLYKYLKNNGVIENNPMDKLSAVRKDRRLPVCIEEDKMEQLLDQLQSAELFADLRDLLMLELLYGTGMRLSELIGLRHSDVDEMRGRVLITGKGNKQRSVPLLGEVLQVYERYVAEKQKVFGTDSGDWVFVTNKGAQLYPGFVYRRVRHYLGRVSTRTRKSPHVLRHSFATHMLNRGAELNAIKKLLGHSSLAATQVYTHNTIDKIKQVYKQAHPKA